jgi:predicted Zn finger-like uncharacterized protein
VFASCDNCDAEYELDEAKIPAGGARLRCTSCDHLFVIVPPEASDLQSADDLAHDALATGALDEADPDLERESASEEGFELDGTSEPESASEEGFELDGACDLESASEEGFELDGASEPESASEEGFELDGASEPESASEEGFELDGASEPDSVSEEGFELDGASEPESVPEEDFDPDGESDWEFNDEVGTSESEVDEEVPEPAFDRDGEWGDLSAAEDVVDDLLGPAGAIDTDAATAVDDLLGEIDTAAAHLGKSDGGSTSGAEPPSERLELADADAFNGSAGNPAAGGDDSFEDLSSWDVFDQPVEADASAAPKNRPAAAARDGARAEPRVEIAVAMADDSPTTVRWTDRVSEIAGWGAVLLMMIVALVGGLASNSSDARAPAGSWSGAGFEADQIVGRWVDNAVAGSIYVVSGRIRGAPGSDRASQKSLGIRLFDTMGREIDRDPIPLAPTVPERILRESSPAELDAFQTRRAGRIAAVGTRWVSFEAVLTDLPRFAGRFELQAFDR